MSHGKETPRQKMINLMYLILTCLLALNVSRDVLLGFVTINESLEQTNSNFTNNTQKLMKAFEEAIEQGHPEVKPYYAKALVVRSLTKETKTYLDSLKKQLIAYTENSKGADTLTLGEAEKLDDYDRPTYMLIGDDESKPKADAYSAGELKNKIDLLCDSLVGMLDFMKNRKGLILPEKDEEALRARIKDFRPREDYIDKDGKPVAWELKNFYNQPLASAVTYMSKLQSDILNIEGEMVNVFASAAGKLALHFNTMEARIVPVSQYVQSGTMYTADVFLSASSSEFTADNIQFILGDVDTSTGQLGPGAQILPVDRGTGKITVPTPAIGHKEIKGWIKLKEGTGNIRYFRYENEYIVANAAVAVSPDKMNVFYAGVDNPVTISAAGVSPEDLSVKIEGGGGKITSAGNGKYSVTVQAANTGIAQTTITVFQKTADGLKKQGTPQVFRVKKFPTPSLKIIGKPIIGSLDMSLAEAKSIQQINLDLSNFEFNAPFQIKQFVAVIIGGGRGYQEYKCENNKLSPDALRAYSQMKRGAKLYFEDIKVQAPDGMRDVAMVKVNVK